MHISYRTMAGIGAAAIGVLFLAKAGTCLRKMDCCPTGEYVRKTAKRMEGMIRRRSFWHNSKDVI